MTPADLKAWRHRAGLSQPELASLLGIHWMSLSKWERGLINIPPLLPLALWALEHGYLEQPAEHL